MRVDEEASQLILNVGDANLDRSKMNRNFESGERSGCQERVSRTEGKQICIQVDVEKNNPKVDTYLKDPKGKYKSEKGRRANLDRQRAWERKGYAGNFLF